jgi:hypothetical protein
VTLSLILRFNLRLRGYSICSAIFHRTPYQRSNLGHKHLIASMQPRKYSKKNFKMELQKKPKTTSKVLEEPAVPSYEELGGLSHPGLRDCVHNVVHIELEDRTCPIPYLCCTLLACEVGLADTEGSVAEPPELFQLKCPSHRYTADTNSTHFKRNNSLVCRVSARCNHGSTGSKQVYLARRQVYSRTSAHQLLIHRILNIITNRFKFKVINKHFLKRQAKHACQVHSGRKLTHD